MNRLLAMTLCFFLAACNTAPERPDDDLRKAAETNTALGRQYMERGQNEVALEKLKRAIAFDKTYAPAHTMLAFLYENIGALEDAEKEYRDAVKYDPDDGDVNNNLGAFLCRIGRHQDAEPYFQKAIDDPFYQTPEIAMANAGDCAIAANDLDKAESFLRQSLEIDAQLSGSLLSMAEVSYRKASYLRARGFLQRFEAVSPKTEESLVLGYKIERELGDSEAAERYRNQLQQQYPGAIRVGGSAGREKE